MVLTEVHVGTIRVASAPISWGVCEIPGWGPQLRWERVLDEMSQAGYEGTELGPWGFLPADPHRLQDALRARGLQLVAAFVPLPLRDPESFGRAEVEVRRTSELLARCGGSCVVFADAGDEARAQAAGRVELTRTCGLAPDEWPGYGERASRLARLVRQAYGLQVAFHPHGGTYVENPEEVEALLSQTDPEVVGLCLDTGHLLFGGGDPVEVARRHAARINHVHLKDVDVPRLRQLLAQGLAYAEVAKQGTFVELGCGSVDLPAIAGCLQAAGYRGWLVVEQDRVVTEDTDTLASAARNRDYVRRVFGV